jgi:hypothetical protein
LFEKDRVYTIQEFFQIPRYILWFSGVCYKGTSNTATCSMMFDALLFCWKWWHMFYVCCNQISFVAHAVFYLW